MNKEVIQLYTHFVILLITSSFTVQCLNYLTEQRKKEEHNIMLKDKKN